MSTKNPFQSSMTRLVLPAHMGPSVSIAGFELQADDDGVVEVPNHLAGELRAHGLKDAPAKAEASAAGKGKGG